MKKVCLLSLRVDLRVESDVVKDGERAVEDRTVEGISATKRLLPA